MNKDEIKAVIANILYLNSKDEVDDTSSIFTELGLSSIDYIDLCFEIGNQSGIDLAPDTLWPINKLILENQYYDNSMWTDRGWGEVCHITGLNPKSERLPLKKLYDHFTVNYIEKRLSDLA